MPQPRPVQWTQGPGPKIRHRRFLFCLSPPPILMWKQGVPHLYRAQTTCDRPVLGPQAQAPEVGGSPRGRAAWEPGTQREKEREGRAARARRSNSRRLQSTGEPHPLRHQRRPANGRAGKAGLASEGPGGGAARGGREAGGGLRLTDSSFQPIPGEASPLASLPDSALGPAFSSATPPPGPPGSLLRVPPLLPSPTLRANHCWQEAGAEAAGSCGALRQN